MGIGGKHIPSLGHVLVSGNALLSGSGLTGMLVANGISGNASLLWLDIYTVSISTSDTVAETIMLSDGTSSVTYYIGGGVAAPPINDSSSVPYRFKTSAPLMCSANGISGSAKTSVAVRGVLSTT
jgi:hypothetical protein